MAENGLSGSKLAQVVGQHIGEGPGIVWKPASVLKSPSDSDCPLEPIERCGKPRWNGACRNCQQLALVIGGLARHEVLTLILGGSVFNNLTKEAQEEIAEQVRENVTSQITTAIIACRLAIELDNLDIQPEMSDEARGVIAACQILAPYLRRIGDGGEDSLLFVPLQEAAKAIAETIS